MIELEFSFSEILELNNNAQDNTTYSIEIIDIITDVTYDGGIMIYYIDNYYNTQNCMTLIEMINIIMDMNVYIINIEVIGDYIL